jgi:anaerobic magnesium-protoporphyrin IX monomethyl ester cyclase
MHVLLIQPSQYKDEVSLLYGKLGSIEQPPMGLAMLAGALLKAGFETDIIDIDAQKSTLKEILSLIDQRGTKLVGLSATTPLFMSAVRLSGEIKAQRPEVLICLGGYHASMEPLSCLEPPSIDFVVRGEGEEAIVELARAVADGAGAGRLSQVKGLFFRDQGKPVENPEHDPIMDLDSLPMPARHLLHNQNYTYPDTKYSPAFPVYTSRGCPGKCSFCLQHYVSGRRLRLRSASKVADEIEHLISKYGAREIHFWDDMFSTNKKHVFAMRDEIKGRGIKIAISFPAGIRVDTASVEVLEAMKAMGGYSVAFGVESGVQEILDNCKKGITLAEVRAAVRNAKKIGLETWCFFMFGLPGETKETVKRTIDFAAELDPDVVKFHVFKPFPGSELYQQMKAQGLILDFDTEKYAIHTYPIHRTEQMSAEEIFKAQQQAYRGFYFRPRTLVKQFFRLNSWTRVKNNVSVGLRILRMGF